MSRAKPAMVMPALTTPETDELRCRSQAVGVTNHEAEAVIQFVESEAVAPLRVVTSLFVRLLRINTAVVAG
jgi:hypothetical protein